MPTLSPSPVDHLAAFPAIRLGHSSAGAERLACPSHRALLVSRGTHPSEPTTRRGARHSCARGGGQTGNTGVTTRARRTSSHPSGHLGHHALLQRPPPAGQTASSGRGRPPAATTVPGQTRTPPSRPRARPEGPCATRSCAPSVRLSRPALVRWRERSGDRSRPRRWERRRDCRAWAFAGSADAPCRVERMRSREEAARPRGNKQAWASRRAPDAHWQPPASMSAPAPARTVGPAA